MDLVNHYAVLKVIDDTICMPEPTDFAVVQTGLLKIIMVRDTRPFIKNQSYRQENWVVN
jgi:hypothetical protein